MRVMEAFEEAQNGAAGGAEAAFQHLDIERLFVDSDEMTVMKTLQNMHLANFQLDNEIKSVMTDEIDPILLYSGNMLGICSLVKQTQTAMNELATLCRTFGAGDGDGGDGKDPQKDDEQEILHFINQCAMHYQLDGSFGSIFEQTERLNHIEAMIKAVQMLKRLSMDNFRLLKANKFVKSYKLLKVKAPVLIALVKHVIQHEESMSRSHSSAVYRDDMSASVEGASDPACAARHSRRRMLATLHPHHLRDFIRETHSVLDYNTAKLMHNCETAIGSSNISLLVEAAICLAMANEHDGEYTQRLWEMRINSTKVESSRLVLGCLSSCQEVMAQLLASVIYHIFCQRLSTEALAKMKRLLEIPVSGEENTAQQQQQTHEFSFNDQSYWLSAMELISRNFERVDLDDIVDFYNGIIGVIETVNRNLDSNTVLLNVFSELGVDLVQQFTSAAEDMLKQVKELYHKSALASAVFTVEDIQRRMQAREMCTTHIKALGKFVAKADTDIAAAVNERMADVLDRIGAEIQDIEGPTPADGVLDTYGEEGSVQRWLRESRINNLVLNMEAFWHHVEKHALAVVDGVANKCIVPLGGDDNTVKTLVGASALGSQYSIIGARLFPRCLKRASLESCLNAHGDRDKALLVLSFRDAGLAEGSETLRERFKELELEVGVNALEEHAPAYDSLRNFI